MRGQGEEVPSEVAAKTGGEDGDRNGDSSLPQNFSELFYRAGHLLSAGVFRFPDFFGDGSEATVFKVSEHERVPVCGGELVDGFVQEGFGFLP